ncbi:hypothetical protein M0813_23339 [Anaeramoeba flamelloides]|uniref:Uncharacterized protein n=1 Tax=Anaeramoeba flamelloides TaxID=1746091 RepID=A0ABQ8Y8K8_9EUKA|nr:hypothetical protein M0813_23339 [Anaeramoeba flamelloides]
MNDKVSRKWLYFAILLIGVCGALISILLIVPEDSNNKDSPKVLLISKTPGIVLTIFFSLVIAASISLLIHYYCHTKKEDTFAEPMTVLLNHEEDEGDQVDSEVDVY